MLSFLTTLLLVAGGCWFLFSIYGDRIANVCGLSQDIKKCLKTCCASKKENVKEEVTANIDGVDKKKKNQGKLKKTNTPPVVAKISGPKDIVEHPLLVSMLRSHDKGIIACGLSSDRSKLVAVSGDNLARLWTFSSDGDFAKTASTKIKIDYQDTISSVGFSLGDDKNIFAMTAEERRILKINTQTSKIDNKSNFGLMKETVNYMCSVGKELFLMGAKSSKDTIIRLINGKGDALASFDTKQIKNSCYHFQPKENYLAVSAWTAGVRILQVLLTKDTTQIERCIDVGTTEGSMCVHLSKDCEHLFLVTKSKKLQMWRLPTRLASVSSLECELDLSDILMNDNLDECELVVSDLKRTIALAVKSSLHFFDVKTVKIQDRDYTDVSTSLLHRETLPLAHSAKIFALHNLSDSLFLSIAEDTTPKVWRYNA